MIRRSFIAFVALLIVPPAAAQNPSPPTQSAAVMTDTQFLDRVIAENLFEVEAGRLAGTKAVNPKVKEFAKTMVGDHGKALGELQRIAKGLNRDVAEKLTGQHQAKLNSVMSKAGAGFDTAYIGEMKVAHADMLSLLQSHRPLVKVDDVGKWIDQTLPVVQRHKVMVDAM